MHLEKAKNSYILKFSLSFEVKTKNQKQLTEYLRMIVKLNRLSYKLVVKNASETIWFKNLSLN
jgi:16S rRNA G527 N7-methylase RsmG